MRTRVGLVMCLATLAALIFGATTVFGGHANTLQESNVRDNGNAVQHRSCLASAAMLWVEPVEDAYLIGDFFTVQIKLQTTAPFYGGEVVLSYDKDILDLDAASVLPGDVFTSVAPDYFWYTPQIDEVAGTVKVFPTRTYPAGHFTGEGVFVTMRFEAIGAGDTDLTLSNVILADHDANVISPVALAHGLIHSLSPPGEATLWVEPVEDTYLIHDVFTVQIKLQTTALFYGGEVLLTYDKDVLDLDAASVLPGDVFTSVAPDYFWHAPQIDEVAGTVRVFPTRTYPAGHFAGEGVFVTMQFEAKATGDSDLTLSDAILADKEANVISPVTLEHGLVHVPGGGTAVMQGTIELQGRNGPPKDWDGAVITMTHQISPEYNCTMNVTNLDGTWSQANMAAGNYTVEVEMERYLDALKTSVAVTDGNTTTLNQAKLLGGDANDDDFIDILDLSMIGGAFSTTPPSNPKADINDDGTVNILDLVLAGCNYTCTSPVIWP